MDTHDKYMEDIRIVTGTLMSANVAISFLKISEKKKGGKNGWRNGDYVETHWAPLNLSEKKWLLTNYIYIVNFNLVNKKS